MNYYRALSLKHEMMLLQDTEKWKNIFKKSPRAEQFIVQYYFVFIQMLFVKHVFFLKL